MKINKILLVRSSHYANNGKVVKSNSLVDRITNINYAELGLPLIAAYTPDHIVVEMVDDCLDNTPLDTDAEVVGISAMIIHLSRAIDLAREFKKRGKVVIMGGFLPTLHPELVQQYVDSLCIGEADEIWPQMIKDIENDNLKPVYKANFTMNLENIPVPRYDLIKRNRINLYPVQATRGCKNHCDYCTIINFFRNTYRQRPIKDVIRDIEAHGSRGMYFTDDNLMDATTYSKELFHAMDGLKVRWGIQASPLIAEDQELLKLAFQAGCRIAVVGFESVLQSNLNDVSKEWAIAESYKTSVRKIQDCGIKVHALIMLGMPDDNKDTFNKTLDFLEKAGVDSVDFFILTPYPSTPLGKKFLKEDKIIDFDLNHYREPYVVFDHPNMDPVEIQEGFWNVLSEFYSYKEIYRRLLRRNVPRKLQSFYYNMYYRRKIRRKIVPTHNQRGDYVFEYVNEPK